ncbi:MAG: hypothetical protein OXH04_05360 [Acidobacteria bacterium]|nr:hypothetical protein [Acidobacteriota bacterium]
MRLGWLRVSVFTALIGVALASSYWVALLDREIGEGRGGDREFAENAWGVAASLAELRASQLAYIAADADRAFQAEQIAAHTDAIAAGLAELTRLASASGASRAIEAASEAIGDLQGVGAASRERVAAGETGLARDLLLADGTELGAEAAGHVARALGLERTARDDAAARQAVTQARAFFLATGSGVLAALLTFFAALLRARDGEGDDAADPAAAGVDSGVQPATGSSLLDLTLTADTEEDVSPAAAADAPAPEPVVPELDLPAAAVVCTDLGSLASATELPDLLGRAAELLNASGMIVWVNDGSGEALRPAVCHGYSQAMIARLGAIPHDSENATASAFREGRMHVVPADSTGSGAIVAPLISSINCFGVLSAELREGWEARRDVQSLTRIIAAQLATLVAPDAAAAPGSQRAQA